MSQTRPKTKWDIFSYEAPVTRFPGQTTLGRLFLVYSTHLTWTD